MSKDSVPSSKDLAAGWKNVSFSEDTAVVADVQTMVKAFEKSFGKKVFFKSFSIPEGDAAFEWYMIRNRFHEMEFFRKIWQVPDVAAAFPFKLADIDYTDMYTWEWSSPFTLAGMWAWALDIGGAHSEFEMDALGLKALTDAAAAALIQDKYEDTFVVECNVAWNDFFWDEGLDKTWVVINLAARKLHVLMISDVS